MDELTLDNKKYLSSKRAAQVTGYAKDYVGQLCREGRVQARLVGRNWYVLESSILEHRFGAEDQENKEIPSEKATNVTSVWNSPVYTSDPTPLVPEIAPKKLPEASPAPIQPVVNTSKVLTDMQSAWQEWFEAHEKEELMLPDASEMLIEAPLEPEIKEETTPKEEESAFPVHIERVKEPEPESKSVPVELYHEPVAVTRRYIEPKTVQDIPTTPRKAKLKQERKNPQHMEGSSRVLRAVLVSIAGLAIVVAVIGSGLADKYLEHGGTLMPVTHYFGGITEINTK